MSTIERARFRPSRSLATVSDEGEVRVVAVMFADLSGFTAVAEKLAPPALATWLGRYLDAIAEPVLRHDGTVEQVVGDGVLAIFAPATGPATAAATDHVRAAASCALEVAAAVAVLNRRLRAEGWPAVGVRIGLHIGPVVTARLSAGRLGLGTLAGDAINTAARLQQQARGPGRDTDAGTRIVVSDGFRAAMGEGWAVRRLGTMTLRGKRQRITAWQLRAEVEPVALAA